MAAQARLGCRALLWFAAGVGFNVSQRVLDYLLDDGFKQVAWLAWLAN